MSVASSILAKQTALFQAEHSETWGCSLKDGWTFSRVLSVTPLLLVVSKDIHQVDLFCLIAAEFRGHCCFGIFSFIFLCCLECLCSRLQSEIADGFKMKCMLRQTCQCEKNDVWERIRDHGYKRAAL